MGITQLNNSLAFFRFSSLCAYVCVERSDRGKKCVTRNHNTAFLLKTQQSIPKEFPIFSKGHLTCICHKWKLKTRIAGLIGKSLSIPFYLCRTFRRIMVGLGMGGGDSALPLLIHTHACTCTCTCTCSPPNMAGIKKYHSKVIHHPFQTVKT